MKKKSFYKVLFFILFVISFINNSYSYAAVITSANFADSTVVISPNGGENWIVGSAHNLTWISTLATKVNLFYSTNNGVSWNYIAYELANSGTYNWILPNTVSAYCKVKVVNSNNSADFDISNNVFTISSQQNVTWHSYLKLKDSLATEGLLHFGQAQNATSGIDMTLGEFELPPIPLSGIFDARFNLPANPVISSLRDYRNDTSKQISWTVVFQPNNNSYPITFEWSIQSLPVGTFFLKDLTGTLINVDMKKQSSLTLTNQNITQLKIEYSKTTCKDVSVLSNWNLVSVPVKMQNMIPVSVFPTKISSAYGYLNGYYEVDTLKNSKGYWLKFATAQNISLCGEFTGLTNLSVITGWNLIGIYDKNIAVSEITTSPSGILNSYFYGYENGYINSSSILPGKGYWIKSLQNGTINLPILSSIQSGKNPINDFEKFSKIIIKDASQKEYKLYLSDNNSNLSYFELPPQPPVGIADVRFASDRLVESIYSENTVLINSLEYPVEISSPDFVFMLVNDSDGKIISGLTEKNQSIKIENHQINRLKIKTNINVENFALEQNFPNPFNPSTVISYQLPVNSKVTLKVFDILGKEIEILISKEQEAGKYSVEWNASKYSSGVYYYEFSAGNFREIKKMLLVK